MRTLTPVDPHPLRRHARLPRVVGELATALRLRIAQVAGEIHSHRPTPHIAQVLEPTAVASPQLALPVAAPAPLPDPLVPDSPQQPWIKGIHHDTAPPPHPVPGSAGAVPLGHQLSCAGSELYAEICSTCGATDAAGDRRLALLCPGNPRIRIPKPA